MMNLYGGMGLGSNGLGAGNAAGGATGGGGMNPMAMLAMLHGGAGGVGGSPLGAGPPMGGAPAGLGATPLANYIGGPGGMGGGTMHPMAPPGVSILPQSPQNSLASVLGGGGNGTAQLMQMLQQLKGAQTGIQPGGQPGGGQVSPQALLNANPGQQPTPMNAMPMQPGATLPQQAAPGQGVMPPMQTQGASNPEFFANLLSRLGMIGGAGGGVQPPGAGGGY